MQLEGKRIIVTGGLTGIGKATVLACAQEGAKVVSMSRQAPTSDGATRMLAAAKELGMGSVTHMQLDVSKQDDVNRVFAEAVAWLGGLDVLVNSAGVELVKPAESLTAEDLHTVFAVNVDGTVFTCAAAFPYMKDTGGSIINCASIAGVSGEPTTSSYGASKGAVVAYSRSIALAWGMYGIRVNIVCPAVRTELFDQFIADQRSVSEEAAAQAEAWVGSRVVLGGKLGNVEEAANLNVFLASDKARYIHGQTIGVDGGMMMSR